MAERPKVTPKQALNNLADAMVEGIMAMSDEEILDEMREDGLPENLAADVRALFEKVARRHRDD